MNPFIIRPDEMMRLAMPITLSLPSNVSAILDCTKRDDIVLDPFIGSGTTILAAERTNELS